MAALDAADQTRIDNLIIAHDAAKAAMLTIIADSGAGVDQSAATVDVLVLTDSLSTFSNAVTVNGTLTAVGNLTAGGTITSGILKATGTASVALDVSTSFNFVGRFKSTDALAAVTLGDDASAPDGNRWQVQGDVMSWFTANTEALSINESQNAIFAAGVAFSGAAAIAANLLDDYEEGIFTAAVIGISTTGIGTYSRQNGIYTKIGDLPHFQVNLTWTAHTGAGNMRISGLPFVVKSGNRSANAIKADNFTFGVGKQLVSDVADNSTLIILQAIDPAGGTANEITLDIAAALVITGAYKT